MSFWALDYQNPAHFNVVSILTEKGHCYRLNNLRRCKKETVCVQCSRLKARPFWKWPNPSCGEMREQGRLSVA